MSIADSNDNFLSFYLKIDHIYSNNQIIRSVSSLYTLMFTSGLILYRWSCRFNTIINDDWPVKGNT